MPPLKPDPSSFHLTLAERTARYRAKAKAALSQANVTADPSMRNGLLHLAAGWHGLARELETTGIGVAAGAEIAARPAPERPARH